jgi:hypothetical protein
MAVPEIAIVRAVVAYIFREESAKQAASREGFSAVTMRRWLVDAGVHVRSTAQQRALDKAYGRYNHAESIRAAWRRGNFDTEAVRSTRKTGDWGFARDGENNPFFGRRHSPETRERLGQHARERVIASVGEYGPEWTEELRARIVARDGGVCTVCGSTTMLQVHHVDLDRTHSDPRNLLTLCAACHLGYHGRGERAEEIASAHATMLARELGADDRRTSC